MPIHLRLFPARCGHCCVLALLALFFCALSARAQGEITIEETQTLDDQTFAYDVTIGNQLLFAGGDDLIRYQVDNNGQAANPRILPYNGEPIALAATDQLLAVGDFASTLTLFDISDPDNPTQRGAAATAGATLDIVARGTLVVTTPDFFAVNVVEIFDVSDPDNPDRVSRYQPGAFAAGLFLAESGTELLVATEEELEIVDISDPANPALLGSVDLAGRGDEVTLQGTIAFVGSQGQENAQGETGEWFLEAFDVSDLTNPQLLGATGRDNGPLHAMIGLEDGLVLTSSPELLVVFAFQASSGLFKVKEVALNPADGLAVSPTSIAFISPTSLPGLPNNCLPVFTNATTTLPPGSYRLSGLSSDGPVVGYQVKTPLLGGATLTTTYGVVPRIECPGISPLAPGKPLGGGALTAEGEGNWLLKTMTFTVETASENASLREGGGLFNDLKLFIGNKEVDGVPTPDERIVTNPVTNTPDTLMYFLEVVFPEIDLPIASGESLSYQILLLTNGAFGTPICSVMKPVKRQITQLSIHGVTGVDADPPQNGVQLPNADILGGLIDEACVINVTREPNMASDFIQDGIDDAADSERIGVCPGVYKENITFADNQKNRTLFSFKGPKETDIHSLAGESATVVTVNGDGNRLQGFSILAGSNGVDVNADDVLIGTTASGTALGKASFPLILCDACNLISGNRGKGVVVQGKNATIAGNFIGTTEDGKADVGNTVGVSVFNGAEDTHILNNLISGNDDLIEPVGVFVGGKNTVLAGNVIGLDNEAIKLIPNGAMGVGIDKAADGTLVGLPGNGNVISGNRGPGIEVDGKNTRIVGNIIGLTRFGVTDVGNEADGINISGLASNTRIGGNSADLSNFISGNDKSGIEMRSGDGEIRVLGNRIGINALGERAGNGTSGIIVLGSEESSGKIEIGGRSPGEGNTIAHNGHNGILALEVQNLTIRGNTVRGHESDNPSGNRGVGVRLIDVHLNRIYNNTISKNSVGVVVVNGGVGISGNTLRQNTTCVIFKRVGRADISGNILDQCDGAATGLHLTGVANARITGNQFTNNAGAAVMIDSTSSGITLSRNNFIGNPDFGVQNLTPSVVVAQDNFWGSPDGPSGEGTGAGDAVSTGVDFSNFRTEILSVVIAAPDTAAVTIAAPDTVDIFVRNFADLAGTLSITVTDELGWLSDGSPQSVTVTLQDSLAGVVELAALVPEGTPEGTLNRVTLDAVSTADSTQFDQVTLILIADDPTTNVAIEADPEAEVELPEGFRLTAAYPNPFNPQAQFTLTLGASQRVEVAVYDVLGRRVAVLHEGLLSAGQAHHFVLDGRSWSSGVYYYQVVGEHLRATRSVMLVK